MYLSLCLHCRQRLPLYLESPPVCDRPNLLSPLQSLWSAHTSSSNQLTTLLHVSAIVGYTTGSPACTSLYLSITCTCILQLCRITYGISPWGNLGCFSQEKPAVTVTLPNLQCILGVSVFPTAVKTNMPEADAWSVGNKLGTLSFWTFLKKSHTNLQQEKF